eukprot:511985_1
MAKTFDSIEEDTIGAIIFARFKLSLDLDTTASFMPPPLNVLAMLLLIIFYIIEWLLYSTKRIINFFGCCINEREKGVTILNCCGKILKKEVNQDEMLEVDKMDFIKWDLAVFLMPLFMKERKLELDEQILYDNPPKKTWIIKTNKGDTIAKFLSYKPEIAKFYVSFYKENINYNKYEQNSKPLKGIDVSVM